VDLAAHLHERRGVGEEVVRRRALGVAEHRPSGGRLVEELHGCGLDTRDGVLRSAREGEDPTDGKDDLAVSAPTDRTGPTTVGKLELKMQRGA